RSHRARKPFLPRLLDQALDPALRALDQTRLRLGIRGGFGVDAAVELELGAVAPREPLALLERRLDQTPRIDDDEDLADLKSRARRGHVSSPWRNPCLFESLLVASPAARAGRPLETHKRPHGSTSTEARTVSADTPRPRGGASYDGCGIATHCARARRASARSRPTCRHRGAARPRRAFDIACAGRYRCFCERCRQCSSVERNRHG